MVELGLGLAFEFWNDALGKYLSQLDAPLAERVDLPDGALSEDAVFVQRDQFPMVAWLSDCIAFATPTKKADVAEHPIG